jgi:hypothetical protein
VDQDAAPVRPTTSWLLRELDLQLEAAADALCGRSRRTTWRAAASPRAAALAQLQAEQEADDAAEADPRRSRSSAASS